MKNADAEKHVRGESRFLDDIPVPAGTLYAHVVPSATAHGTIRRIDCSTARKMEGVRDILTASDIPGENQIGAIIPDEELLASQTVHFCGQPLAVVIADDPFRARYAAEAVVQDIAPLPVVTDPRAAFARNDLIGDPITFSLGNIAEAWRSCEVIVEGSAETGGQEHLYLETQCALAWPVEGGGIKIISSTQSPTALQRTAARVLNIPMHLVEVDVARLGGGFGGKEDQATPWGALAALAARKLQHPVKLVLHRQDDMRMTGKRHPYVSDFRIGLTDDGIILAYQVRYYQNAGAAADLSPAVLQRTLFHATNSYYIPNVHAVGYSCRTNLPPNTAFRGFGGPQAMFVMEAAITKAAERLGMDRELIQKKNLLGEGSEFPYGQSAESCRAAGCWNGVEKTVPLKKLKRQISAFNAGSHWTKKGFALMPVCFGISFTKTSMNQASALVHIYTDGSVGISTAAIEMGQGVNAKIQHIAERVLGIPADWIKLETTNTTRIANTSPTAASSGADLNGMATSLACTALLKRLKKLAAEQLADADEEAIIISDGIVFHAGKKTGLGWRELVALAHERRISLSEHQHYATPRIHFDVSTSKGRPFAYHVYGSALIEVTVDCLRGIYRIDSVTAVHDAGQSLHPAIDLSQTEGGLMQGIGWMTMEEVLYDDHGRLLTDALSTYKVPDLQFTPGRVDIQFLKTPENACGPFNSKAIGEPPLMYGIGAFFAIREAMKAFRPGRQFGFVAPLTPERVLTSLYEPVTSPEPAHS